MLGSLTAPPADPAALRQAAQKFEAMTINQMLAPMFDTVDTAHGMFGGGAGEAAFRPMLIDALAKKMEAAGGLGLGDAIYRALLGSQEAKR
jgi:Rod binding domain-containing protein